MTKADTQIDVVADYNERDFPQKITAHVCRNCQQDTHTVSERSAFE